MTTAPDRQARDGLDTGDLIGAAAQELRLIADLLRRAERSVFAADAAERAPVTNLPDTQLIDVAIQMLDDLAPFLAELSVDLRGLPPPEPDRLFDGIRLAGLRARLSNCDSDAQAEASGSIELF